MSFILESLKEVERERRKQQPHDLGTLFEETPVQRHRSRRWHWLAALLAVNVIILAVAFLFWENAKTPSEATTEPSTGVSASSQDAAKAPEAAMPPAQPVAHQPQNPPPPVVASKASPPVRPPAQSAAGAFTEAGPGAVAEDKPALDPAASGQAAALSVNKAGLTRPAGKQSVPSVKPPPKPAIAQRPSTTSRLAQASLGAAAPPIHDTFDNIAPWDNTPDELHKEDDLGVFEKVIQDENRLRERELPEVAAGVPPGDNALASTAPAPGRGLPPSTSAADNRLSSGAAVARSSPGTVKRPPAAPRTPERQRTAPRAAKPPKAAPPPAIEERVPRIRELPADVQQRLGDLVLNILAYDQDQDKSMAFINFRRYRVGERIGGDGPLIERITPRGVILNYGNGKCLLQTK